DKEIEEMVDNAIKKGRSSHVREVGLIKKYFEIFITPVKDNQQKIVGCAIIIHDITHIKEIDAMKTEFVSVASHQLRTPLTAIKLFTEMMLKGDVGKLKKEQEEYLTNIYQSTERMVRLVNDLLSLSRLESGRLRIDPKPTDLNIFIESIINEVKPVAKVKGVKINFFPGEKMPKIKIDPVLIRQVVHNLVTNSVRYSSDNKGIVEINTRRGNKEYMITIKDNGIGIPDKLKPRIFEKFYRADNAVKTNTEGTGLGLYVARLIVENSGGKIWFESKEGEGTTFFVTLPVAGMEKKEGDKTLAVS
ncbi:PAS domain-containing sensor histidine kinase, partial [bacterium]|nr:PAS domain-containing sensor histidine kinase [bacterium]